MDITPLIPADRQVIQAYGKGRFRVNGALFDKAIIVFPERTISWPGADLTVAALEPALASAGEVELLLVGCGPRAMLVPSDVRQALRQVGIVVDAMDTGAACRTYNVLLAEGRLVAAALMPV